MRKRTILAALLCSIICLTACTAGGDENKEKQEMREQNQTGQQQTPSSKEPKVYDSAKAAAAYAEHERLQLWEDKSKIPFYDESLSGKTPTITPYIAEENTNGGCVIVCPGGGYVSLATEKEGTKPAMALNENHISAFVLEYRIKPYTKEAILSDVCRAIRYVRYHAEEFGIDPDKISIMGFSAGGHLSAMALEHYEEDEQNTDEIDKVSAKPDYGILCYPVISLKDELTHEVTREAFLGTGQTSDQELIKKYSAEEGVTKKISPVFIWHCEKDQAVPVANSEKFAEAMKEAGVDCELHIYPYGAHGLGMAENNDPAKEWFPACVKWLQKYGY